MNATCVLASHSPIAPGSTSLIVRELLSHESSFHEGLGLLEGDRQVF